MTDTSTEAVTKRANFIASAKGAKMQDVADMLRALTAERDALVARAAQLHAENAKLWLLVKAADVRCEACAAPITTVDHDVQQCVLCKNCAAVQEDMADTPNAEARHGNREALFDMTDQRNEWRAQAMRMTAQCDALAEKFQWAVRTLAEIARQKKTDELETEYDVEMADFEGGYDLCIDRARATLSEIHKARTND